MLLKLVFESTQNKQILRLQNTHHIYRTLKSIQENKKTPLIPKQSTETLKV
uniref:Uncharacterized protein MANES_02G030500 n=1 Tax=Rhizophora mucronata TaxID=61149 RepID=A0A2P2LEW8_RHIMU